MCSTRWGVFCRHFLICTHRAVPHAAPLTRTCYSDWPLLLAASQSSYWTVSILMDADVHYYWVPVAFALHPRSPYRLLHLNTPLGNEKVKLSQCDISTLWLLRGRNTWRGRSEEEQGRVSYTTAYFLILTARPWLVLVIIDLNWLEYNPGSYLRSLFWSEKHARTDRHGNKSTSGWNQCKSGLKVLCGCTLAQEWKQVMCLKVSL